MFLFQMFVCHNYTTRFPLSLIYFRSHHPSALVYHAPHVPSVRAVSLPFPTTGHITPLIKNLEHREELVFYCSSRSIV